MRSGRPSTLAQDSAGAADDSLAEISQRLPVVTDAWRLASLLLCDEVQVDKRALHDLLGGSDVPAQQYCQPD